MRETMQVTKMTTALKTATALAALMLAATPAFAHNGDYSLSDFPSRTFICENQTTDERITIDVDTSISLLRINRANSDRRYPIVDDTVIYHVQTDEFGLHPKLVPDLARLDLGDNGTFVVSSGRWWFQEGKYTALVKGGAGYADGVSHDSIEERFKATYVCLAPSPTWTR